MDLKQLHEQYDALTVRRDALMVVCDAQPGDYLGDPVPHEKFEELSRVEAEIEEMYKKLEEARLKNSNQKINS